MITDQGRATEKATKEVVAQHLAKKHYEFEEGLTHIYRLTRSAECEGQETEPIKFLEVNAAATEAVGVRPLHFKAAPNRGVPFPVVIVEVTPAEFEQIQSGHLKLPNGWQVGEEFVKPIFDDAGDV